ncbi:aldehyde dehydrogenase (NADP(+)) [Pseudovibrio sp. Tun.PSC04-5.I4]|uniref:aldehyde dehydrogenase (NADP(+)) n=1 Tax=Pseudovibrio sp. Tun.PSC04-5.I4 TaxID=1798213 RepID=UPI0008921F94|nr:aldehyde dehydrogenase (NADP(+)) [Pseudovibrio sp. Tun.PSC04-5.I4]SDQ11937.1 NADP-dependent aldehyde dehydrogenase [Pseudovibrio sp. Tun.PSC04-5.I4]SDQ24917.1 NADP-dependent aldehyde dehydrogenase [Pseudovibrio sp. Tun.PSC04-5.I4]
MLTGCHLIAGKWVDNTQKFQSTPYSGDASSYSCGTAELIDKAVQGAEDAFMSFGWSSRSERATFIRKIAEEIDARGAEITKVGCAETGLPEMRLNGERGRTVGQLRLFADHIEKGDYLDLAHDKAIPDRAPLPRPDIRLSQRPVGPVAVFGASNFPLAFSTAGGDTASALAAGCPVVVKGHEAHPGTAELVAQAIDAAIKSCGMHPGVFSLVQGGSREVGTALVKHPLIKAVGFTGSLAGGRALFDLCVSRPEPIPFFGELGSVNPSFLFPNALASRGEAIAAGWAGSLCMGAGQFCTNPGVMLVVDGPDTDAFIAKAKGALEAAGEQPMLTDGIAAAYRASSAKIADEAGVEELVGTACTTRGAKPYMFVTDAANWLKNKELQEEVFGPLGIVVKLENLDQMHDVAKQIEGQLTCSVHVDAADYADARKLMPLLERKAGRVLANGFPTGVEVCDAMVHGGPYPASTNFGATSVGTMAIRRFLRPVSYQDIPLELVSSFEVEEMA